MKDWLKLIACAGLVLALFFSIRYTAKKWERNTMDVGYWLSTTKLYRCEDGTFQIWTDSYPKRHIRNASTMEEVILARAEWAEDRARDAREYAKRRKAPKEEPCGQEVKSVGTPAIALAPSKPANTNDSVSMADAWDHPTNLVHIRYQEDGTNFLTVPGGKWVSIYGAALVRLSDEEWHITTNFYRNFVATNEISFWGRKEFSQ